jgi:hypothetical protein
MSESRYLIANLRRVRMPRASDRSIRRRFIVLTCIDIVLIREEQARSQSPCDESGHVTLDKSNRSQGSRLCRGRRPERIDGLLVGLEQALADDPPVVPR